MSGDSPVQREAQAGALPPSSCPHLTLPGCWTLTQSPGQVGECGSDGFSTFDVPIFTEEFLDQNKGTEAGERGLTLWGWDSLPFSMYAATGSLGP